MARLPITERPCPTEQRTPIQGRVILTSCLLLQAPTDARQQLPILSSAEEIPKSVWRIPEAQRASAPTSKSLFPLLTLAITLPAQLIPSL